MSVFYYILEEVFAMTWMNVVAMLVWTGASAVLLFAIMWVDSIFYKNTMI